MKKLFKLLAAALVMITCLTGDSQAQFTDDFDSYLANSSLHGVNGWQGWDNDSAFTALVSNTFANSGSNSCEIAPTSDLINRMGNPTSGVWELTADQYIPAGLFGDQYFIVQNTYNDGGPYNWSVQLLFSGIGGTASAPNSIEDDFDPAVAPIPIVYDQWIPLRLVIDLDNDTLEQYYNGDLINSTDQVWTTRGGDGANAQLAIGALDLFSNGGSTIYYDNISLAEVMTGPIDVTPASLTVTAGNLSSGGLPEISASDNSDLSIFRSPGGTAAITTFVAEATSPTMTPTRFDITLEGSCVARSNVVQRIRLFDYVANDWETIDERNANRAPNPDLSTTVSPTGDLSRFVGSAGEIQVEIRYRGDRARLQYASNTDLVLWTIE